MSNTPASIVARTAGRGVFAWYDGTPPSLVVCEDDSVCVDTPIGVSGGESSAWPPIVRHATLVCGDTDVAPRCSATGFLRLIGASSAAKVVITIDSDARTLPNRDAVHRWVDGLRRHLTETGATIALLVEDRHGIELLDAEQRFMDRAPGAHRLVFTDDCSNEETSHCAMDKLAGLADAGVDVSVRLRLNTSRLRSWGKLAEEWRTVCHGQAVSFELEPGLHSAATLQWRTYCEEAAEFLVSTYSQRRHDAMQSEPIASIIRLLFRGSKREGVCDASAIWTHRRFEWATGCPHGLRCTRRHDAHHVCSTPSLCAALWHAAAPMPWRIDRHTCDVPPTCSIVDALFPPIVRDITETAIRATRIAERPERERFRIAAQGDRLVVWRDCVRADHDVRTSD